MLSRRRVWEIGEELLKHYYDEHLVIRLARELLELQEEDDDA
jgi:hypothetical protein